MNLILRREQLDLSNETERLLHLNATIGHTEVKKLVVLVASSVVSKDVVQESVDLFLLVNHSGEIIKAYTICPDALMLIIVKQQEFNNSVLLHQRLLQHNNDILTTLSGQVMEQCALSKFPSRCITILTAFSRPSEVLGKLADLGSSAASELKSRAQTLEDLAAPSDDVCACAHNLRRWLYLSQTFLNIILGLMTLLMILHYGDVVSMWLISHTESTVRSMMALLEWLMGVPAGLKLNYRLTIFLGKFFTFHVWLWAGYLTIAGRVLSHLLRAVGWIGVVGGLSLQLAVLQDVLRVFTLHLFCFYIYSARLYALVVHTLLALSRLFRGKKWNSLRLRVDTASYDITQLFLGTLIFSILLFLTPTVLLYYLVFTAFRLAILALQGSLELIRAHLRHSYLLLHFMALCQSSKLKDDLHLSVSPASENDITVIQIDLIQNCKYSEIREYLKLQTPCVQPDVTRLALSVVRGDIL